MLNFADLSNNLLVFICPMFVGSQRADSNSILAALPPITDSHERVRFPDFESSEYGKGIEHGKLKMSKDIATDFNRFLSDLALRLKVTSDLSGIKEDIINGLNDNCHNFATNSFWCHISKLRSNCVADFMQTFFRDQIDEIGLVLGLFHSTEFYQKSWETVGSLESFAQRISALDKNSIHDGALDKFLSELRQSPDIVKADNAETPGLEVSLRLPIRKPIPAEEANFLNGLESIRSELNQACIGIFDQDVAKMHFFWGLGRSSTGGSVKITETSIQVAVNRGMRHATEFLTQSMAKINESVKINMQQPPTVHNRAKNGSLLPPNDAYLSDLISNPHLGFSYFPPTKISNKLNNIMLIDGGRWFWDATFPYHTKPLADVPDGTKALVLLDVTPNHMQPNRQTVLYAHHSPKGNCLCGNCYPNVHDPKVNASPIGNLRAPCNASLASLPDAGDPKSVLETKHLLLGSSSPEQDAGQDWETAMLAIS